MKNRIKNGAQFLCLAPCAAIHIRNSKIKNRLSSPVRASPTQSNQIQPPPLPQRFEVQCSMFPPGCCPGKVAATSASTLAPTRVTDLKTTTFNPQYPILAALAL